MMKLQSAKQLLFDKRSYYIDVTRKIRWLVIVLVVATLPPKIFLTPVMLALVVSAVFYNSLWYRPWFRARPWLGSFVGMNIIDNGFILFLVTITGGIDSPYYVLFTFMAITATYWFGYRGLAILGLFHISLAGGLYWLHDSFTIDTARVGIILLSTFVINGILAERLTHGDRQERLMATQASQELEVERQRLLSLINSIGDAVIAVDKDGKVLMHNGAAMELLDTNMELVGEPVDTLLAVKDEKGSPVQISSLLKNSIGVERRRDLSFEATDKTDIKLDITISPITATGSRQELSGGYIFILRDITKEKSLDETRNEFISVTSHELRTPIAIAEASLSTALLPEFTPKNEKTRDMVKKAHENVTFLGALVQDLSTLAKAERGILKVDISNVDPARLVRGLRNDYGSEAKRKRLDLKVSADDGVKPIVTSEYHVREILQNFITNSIKYTQEGSITLGVSPDKGGRGAVFYVADTGIGISASDKKRIFDKFYRSEDYRTRQTGGTGLGLYVTRKLAERLGGEVWFDSKLNQGSTFYLRVPSSAAPKSV